MNTKQAIIIGSSIIVGFLILAFAELINNKGRYQIESTDGYYANGTHYGGGTVFLDTKTGVAYSFSMGKVRRLPNPIEEE